METLRTENQTNYLAFLKTRDMEEEKLDWSDWNDRLHWGEGYEILSGSYPEITDPDGQLVYGMSHEQRDAEIEKWAEALEKVEEAYTIASEVCEEIETEGEAAFVQSESTDDPAKSEDLLITSMVEAGKQLALEERIEALGNRITRIDTYLEELDDLEYEYHEVGYFIMRRWYRDEIDLEVAARVGLGVIHITSDEVPESVQGQWVFLVGGGMDMSAKFVAYQALHYGAIDNRWAHTLREPGYHESVVDTEVWAEAMEKLGIGHCMEALKAASKERMDRFNNRIKALSGPEVPQEIKMFGALAALAESETK